MNAFIGREREVSLIVDLLLHGDARMVTLTGPGGVGKTRLATRVAEEVAAEFDDGVRFVSLAAVMDASFVARAVAQASGVRETRGQDLVDRLADSLGAQRTLLVLDNFEHVLAAVPVVARLLARAPGLTVLATSREPLRLSAERVFDVPPMALPDLDLTVAELAAADAVVLFVDRARAARADFQLSEGNAAAVTGVCRRLDGLPLAIELAAARIAHLPPAALLARLEHSLPVLTSGARDLPLRQQTLRHAIAWSYDLLTSDEQMLFRRLAVFVGGFTLDAAEAICRASDEPAVDLLDGVASLVAKSLLRQEGHDEEPRFRMLETVRELALERLAETGEEAAIRENHAAWYTEFGRQRGAEFLARARPETLARLEAEHGNFRAALLWLHRAGRTADLLQLATALEWFWYLADHHREGLDWLERALDQTGDAPVEVRAEAMSRAGHFARLLGDYQSASRYLNQAWRLAREARALKQEIGATIGLGILAEDQADFDAAQALFRTAGDLIPADSAEPLLHFLAVNVTYHLGVVAFGQGRFTQAEEHFRQAIMSADKIGDLLHPAWSLFYLVLLATIQGDCTNAARWLSDFLTMDRHFLKKGSAALRIAAAATVASTCGFHSSAARLFGASTGVSEGHYLLERAPEGEIFHRAQEMTRRDLDEAVYDAAFQEGQRLSHEQIDSEMKSVIAAGAERVPVRANEPGNPSGLTRREMDVLRLLVQGKSNPDIADVLFISPRTAQTHVTNILAKLGVASRAEAAARAVRDGLI